MGILVATALCRMVGPCIAEPPPSILSLLSLGGLSLMAGWPLQASVPALRLPRGLQQALQVANSLRTYSYKCLLLAWRLLGDMLFTSAQPISVPGSHTLVAAPARCWDLCELSRFDHQIFPKTTSPLETVFYLLRIKLLGGTRLFIIRDKGQRNRLVASLYIRQLPDSTVGFVSNVGVHPEYRRQKLAKWMMQTLALPLANKMELTKLVLNVREPFVESFYERQGFRRYRGDAFEISTPEGESPMYMELR